MDNAVEIETVEALAPYEDAILEIAIGRADPETNRLDWEDVLYRIERDLDIYLPSQMDHPVIRQIQKIARAAVREAAI